MMDSERSTRGIFKGSLRFWTWIHKDLDWIFIFVKNLSPLRRNKRYLMNFGPKKKLGLFLLLRQDLENKILAISSNACPVTM